MKNQRNLGLLLAIFCYLLWGFLTYFWSLLDNVNSIEVFCYRVLFTIVAMLLYFFISRKTKKLSGELTTMWRNKKALVLGLAASLFLGANWLTFIYSVSINEATEASIANFIMPLVSILFAVVFLRERLDRYMFASVACAILGVVVMVIDDGRFPILVIIMSVCFPIYTLLKKFYTMSSDVAMVFESLVLLPLVIFFLVFFAKQPLWIYPPMTIFWLVLSGPVTAIPLLLFAEAIKRAPLSLVSFVQYLNPTISLLVSVTLLGETLTRGDGYSLIFIASGILIFFIGQIILLRRKQI